MTKSELKDKIVDSLLEQRSKLIDNSYHANAYESGYELKVIAIKDQIDSIDKQLQKYSS